MSRLSKRYSTLINIRKGCDILGIFLVIGQDLVILGSCITLQTLIWTKILQRSSVNVLKELFKIQIGTIEGTLDANQYVL